MDRRVVLFDIRLGLVGWLLAGWLAGDRFGLSSWPVIIDCPGDVRCYVLCHRRQARAALQVIRRYIEAWTGAGLKVLVNFVGLSRGGIGGLYLAQER